MAFIDNYRRIMETVAAAAGARGRNPDDIRLVAVSKTFPAETIQQAIEEGIVLFGENKIQEAKAKIPLLKGGFEFHLVGHLQSNKARDAVSIFSMIHSIDSASTARRLNREAGKIGKVQKILVQVNTSGEDTKSGVEPPDAPALCREILGLENLELNGLMTIGPFTDDTAEIRRSFASLRELLGEINSELGTDLRELSMGMSSDFTIAVEEGATLLRIGTSIFGSRSYGNGTA